MSAQPAPIEVFYSYADTDESLRTELDKHLSQLRRDGLITTWHKRQIIAGQDWTKILDQHLNTASVVLLLVSADFVASDYCYGTEMQRAMERHEAGEAHVIPILLRPVDWQSAPFGKLQALPSSGMPITKWRNRDTAFADIAQSIRVALEDFQRLAVSTPPTDPPRVWNIPYSRNPFFTGQENILTQLTKALKVGQSAALSQPQAINGLGGLGKTQIATEYAYQHHQNYQAVLWTPADTREALVSGYVAIAKLLDLPEKDEQDQSITVNAVLRWLRAHTKWLLILDSADELDIVREFVPPVFGGRILLTTRAQATGSLARRIEVESMLQDTGALFLLRRVTLLALDNELSDADASDILTAREISEELGGLPLALDQAGAYIEETQCSLLRYLHLYRTRRAEMLKKRGNLASDYPESVATTWSLSFEKVEQRCPASKDLLQFSAFLSPDEIPEEIITKGAAHLGTLLQPVASDPLLLDEAISALLAYSLIRRNTKTEKLNIHRLVQAVLRDSMPAETLQQWVQRAIQAVNDALPDVEIANWSTLESLLPHALACASWFEQGLFAATHLFDRGSLTPFAAAHLFNQVGHYLIDRGQYAEAEPLYRHALVIRRKTVGEEHPSTAHSINNLAALYYRQGRYEEAEPLYQRALSIYQQQLGVTHPETMDSLSNLAELYRAQGRHEEAEPLLRRALAFREQQVGSTHSQTASSLTHLALLYQEQGKFGEAESLLKRALSIYEQKWGPAHPDTAIGLNNLAILYGSQGRYTEAEPLLKRALSAREQQLGAEHPLTGQSLNNLALLYDYQGRYTEAEQLYQRALLIYEQKLGPTHTETATGLNNLASIYEELGKLEEAEPLYRRALAIKEQQLGTIHTETASSLNNLAILCQKQGKHAEAEQLLKRALSIYEQKLGPTHPDTARCLNNIAALYEEQGRYDEAETFHQLALIIREQQLGATHPDTAQSLSNLAVLYITQDKYAKAELLLKRALAIYEQKLGLTHPDTASSLHSLANCYYKQGKFEEAEPLLKRVLAINEHTFGATHANTQIVRNNYTILLDIIKRKNAK